MAPRKSGGTKQTGPKDAPKQTIEQLSDDQRQSLVSQHKQKYEKLLADKKAATNALTNFGKIVKADLGDDGLAQVKSMCEAATPEGEAKIKARIESDLQVLRWHGVPIGTQVELFPAVDAAPLDERAFNEGKRHGLAGEPRQNPHHHTISAHAKYEEGYVSGQQTLGTKGFKQTGNGGVPKDEWRKNLAEQNAETERQIKETSAALGSEKPTHQVHA